ncbi:hypothetical protein GCM10023224_33330 [Streptomonospora halophila]|uniref:Uncharacterized protein n=1 Tax=Streptomonospora halophila TaxID=427369 RepID=A0ABP9GNF7_9ACTN
MTADPVGGSARARGCTPERLRLLPLEAEATRRGVGTAVTVVPRIAAQPPRTTENPHGFADSSLRDGGVR